MPLNARCTLVLRPYSSTTYHHYGRFNAHFPHNYGCALQRYLLLLETAVYPPTPGEAKKVALSGDRHSA
ncbi:MAG: hypothetical protein GY805_38295 [Chloroflexi bacterium]|nr:hypothetical protein [Chloroflexota bacterium]